MTESVNGRWLVMEAGDFDQDGFDDLFLGAYFHNVSEWSKLLSYGVSDFPEVLYLQNTSNLKKKALR